MTTSVPPLADPAAVPRTSSRQTPAASVRQARRFVVHGVVQGVGFRPFVHRVATALGLTGWVRNDGALLVIEAAGDAVQLDALRTALAHQAPPLARVEHLVERDLARDDALSGTFTIVHTAMPSAMQGTAAHLTADSGICESCEAELMNPHDRRHRHVFISCTDCGPRWSMLASLPYDRIRTSMAGFALCASCAREYANPSDRRFHAEGICCPRCGPRVAACDGAGQELGEGEQALAAAVAILAAGGIVALHGIGGFHLAVHADNRAAVERLRTRKHRPAKPFAVMVRTIAEARRLVELDAESERVLRGPERPVVIAPLRAGAAITGNVAPGLAELGVMLPSTALHHLLLHDAGVPLVMTSGNASGEPLAATPEEAWRDLAGIADLLLVHDRPVLAPSDDNVLRREPQGLVVMRRARGWSPARISLPVTAAIPLLGLGADRKATVALAQGAQAWLSPHLGDQASFAVQERTAASIARFVSLSQVTPAVIVCDAHPGYASTAMVARWLEQPATAPWGNRDVPAVARIQHHHAHVAAVLVEHGITRPVVALAFDGAGWGPDGTVWGGEVLVADLVSMRRVGALRTAPLLGGDLAAREPWRAALGWLHDYSDAASDILLERLSDRQVQVARHLAAQASTVRTSSMGRLFDAAAALLQLTSRNSYEGEAAARLEALAAGQASGRGTPFPVEEGITGEPWRLDPRTALHRLAEQAGPGASRARLAVQWHDDVAATAVLAALRALDEQQVSVSPTVVLCGGVFQNVRLLHAVRSALSARGITVLTARTLPPNDGAIAIGQVAIAAALHATEGAVDRVPVTFAPAGSTS